MYILLPCLHSCVSANRCATMHLFAGDSSLSLHWWLSVRLRYLQWVSNGDTAAFCKGTHDYYFMLAISYESCFGDLHLYFGLISLKVLDYTGRHTMINSHRKKSIVRREYFFWCICSVCFLLCIVVMSAHPFHGIFWCMFISGCHFHKNTNTSTLPAVRS